MAIQEASGKAIREVAPQAEVEFREKNGRVSATAVASEFEDMLHLDRQRQVWTIVRHDLGAEAKRVGMLLLYSPVEFAAIRDEEDA